MPAWLLIEYLVIFKVLLLNFKAIHKISLSYYGWPAKRSPLSSLESKMKTEVRTMEDRAFLTTHPRCVSILKEMSSSGNPSFFRSKYKIHPSTRSSLRIKDKKSWCRGGDERAIALFNVFTFPVWNVLTQYNVGVQQNCSSRQGGH